MVCRGGRPCW